MPLPCPAADAGGLLKDLQEHAAHQEEEHGGVDDAAGDVFWLHGAPGGAGRGFIEDEGRHGRCHGRGGCGVDDVSGPEGEGIRDGQPQTNLPRRECR